VRPTEHDGDAAAAKRGRELVGTARTAGDDGHTDEISVEREIDVVDPLVEAAHIRTQVLGDQCRQRRQRQRHVSKRLAEDAAAVPVERALR
jgi:hypothetical protein